MSRININNNIYLICRGTSTNDIIDSVNSNKESKSFFNLFNSKKNNNIKKEEFSVLDIIGINELYMLNSNNENSNLINNKLSNIKKIYTSLEYSSIESALIISKDIPNIKIIPLSYLSNKTNIKNNEILNYFKIKFGDKYNRYNDRTNIKNYWKDKIVDNNFLNLKDICPKIEWSYLDKSISSLNSYNLNKIKSIIKNFCEKSIYDSDYLDNVIIMSEGKLIEDILKLCKGTKFNKKRYTIERSSIWEISISGYIDMDYKNEIINSEIKFDFFKKIYPTEYNYKPLKMNGNNYSYEYNYNKFILFNSLLPIPMKYIYMMELPRLSSEKKILIKKILNKKKNNNLKNNNKENKINTNVNSKVNSKFKFELS